MPKRKRKQYLKPRRRFDKARMDEERVLKERYGLKNKKEIWKADARIKKIREGAKVLVTGEEEEKKRFVEKLKKRGFKIESIADALALDKEDWLKRRLQSMVYSKGLANTTRQARQFVVHKHVSIGNQIVNVPSYQVDSDEESKIKLNLSFTPKNKKKSKEEEIKEEMESDKKGERNEEDEVEKKSEGEDKNKEVETNKAGEEKKQEKPTENEEKQEDKNKLEDKE